MPDPVEFSVQVSSLPTDFKGTWNDFLAALGPRVKVTPDVDYSSFVRGAKPTSNAGPWFKDDTQWYSWSDAFGDYVPSPVTVQAPYLVGTAIPNSGPESDDTGQTPTQPSLFLLLDGSGNLIEPYYWNGTAWTPSLKYITSDTEPSTADRSRYWLKTVSGAPSDVRIYDAGLGRWRSIFTTYAVSVTRSGSQNITANGTPVSVDWPVAQFGSPVSSTEHYRAPVTGIYEISASVEWDYTSGDPTKIVSADLTIQVNSSSVLRIATSPRIGTEFSLLTKSATRLVSMSANDVVTSSAVVICNDDPSSVYSITSNPGSSYIQVRLVEAI